MHSFATQNNLQGGITRRSQAYKLIRMTISFNQVGLEGMPYCPQLCFMFITSGVINMSKITLNICAF